MMYLFNQKKRTPLNVMHTLYANVKISTTKRNFHSLNLLGNSAGNHPEKCLNFESLSSWLLWYEKSATCMSYVHIEADYILHTETISKEFWKLHMAKEIISLRFLPANINCHSTSMIDGYQRKLDIVREKSRQ